MINHNKNTTNFLNGANPINCKTISNERAANWAGFQLTNTEMLIEEGENGEYLRIGIVELKDEKTQFSEEKRA